MIWPPALQAQPPENRRYYALFPMRVNAFSYEKRRKSRFSERNSVLKGQIRRNFTYEKLLHALVSKSARVECSQNFGARFSINAPVPSFASPLSNVFPNACASASSPALCFEFSAARVRRFAV